MYLKNLLLAASQATLSEAFFRMSCPGRITRERLDPIVNPGAIAGHVHTVSGGSGFKASMTYQDARASLCSSCTIKVCGSPPPVLVFQFTHVNTLKEDMSNYWTPTLYVRFKDGTFAPVPVYRRPVRHQRRYDSILPATPGQQQLGASPCISSRLPHARR